ncbi:MAG: hypothetical protein ABI343_05395, partial [Burkholderiaceae bacterium]
MSLAAGLRNYAQRHPLVKSFLKTIAGPFRKSTSSAYAELRGFERSTQAQKLKSAWKSDDIPARQREGVERQLSAYRAGVAEKGFDVLVDMVRTLGVGLRTATPLHLLE